MECVAYSIEYQVGEGRSHADPSPCPTALVYLLGAAARAGGFLARWHSVGDRVSACGGEVVSQLTQPIKWHGGKHYLAKGIIELMPPHIHYVEPYFGGGSVLLQKDPEGVSEVVNDVNSALTTFWQVLRDKQEFDLFKRMVEATEFSSDMFELAMSELGDFESGIYKCTAAYTAWAFYVAARQSRQGLMKDFATLSRNRTRRGMNEQVSSWLTAIEGLPDVHARLKRVVILNDDAIKVIKQQDGKNTLFYCDPPYLHETRSTTSDYKYEMSVQQHEELLQALYEIKGDFILSGYNSELYSGFATWAHWDCVEIEIDNKASSKKVKDIKIECLWMNYEPQEILNGKS